eukprot:CAMPEP_0114397228 /NCGR_PEP_ID=MMETSP0102-20121206/14121_1 /TAXON_ID=38822 ORGANISM="Pteridomonas danica, Strain PT" /NCGR_SAMPLE_ID=MMETSP0102 /ASSEMBLY_ACC=CAM_ASM_000212 /LENGTH=69 /DNA_ID=CAMNT_0001558263 /DNA_START=403 /DNA_END=612 /DNA_ORIENTATION=+
MKKKMMLKMKKMVISKEENDLEMSLVFYDVIEVTKINVELAIFEKVMCLRDDEDYYYDDLDLLSDEYFD